MGSTASTAYTLGKETAPAPTMAAGLGGVARAAGNAARERASGALGLGEAAPQGRAAAWNALNRTNSGDTTPEKRRVGKECGSQCRSRGSPYLSKKTNNKT